jgi:serine/threonine protein kinase
MIGKILGKRYEILEKIGGGGMATVYKAHCKLLNRTVAIKVLQSQFANDEEFVKRFRREAQAAASLCHSNIVNIYDVGREDEIDYIVMEYVDGQTLKEHINNNGNLSSESAVSIALQICDALEHAHKNHIVHRDIKPHNILITKEGKVKVTDFGIARAVTSSTLTQTGSVIGSVHYFSPEQARGGVTGVKSDIYSLGVVLYEMLTGHVPFEGESPISVALKHINDKVTLPSALNADIPPSLEKIILKSMSKNQDNRYQSIAEMSKDIRKCLNEPDGNYIELSDGEYDTKELPAIDQTNGDNRGKKVLASTQNPKRRKKTRAVSLVMAAFIIALVSGAFIWGMFWVKDYLTVPIVNVPNVIGLTEEQAEKEFRLVGLKYDVVDRVFDDTPPGEIIDQSPKGGEQVKQDRPPVSIWVSKGQKQVSVPNLVGYTEREAEVLIETYELKKGSVEPIYSNDYPEGIVIDQNPRADIKVMQGTELNYTVSLGPEPQKQVLPDFRGYNIEEVQKTIIDLGLLPGEIKSEKSDKFAKGIIIGQDPQPKTEVLSQTTINFVVSEGPGPSKTKKADLEVKLPSSPKELKVEVVLSDERGDRVIYSNVHKPEDSPLIIPIEGYGNIKVGVFINGEPWGEDYF